MRRIIIIFMIVQVSIGIVLGAITENKFSLEPPSSECDIAGHYTTPVVSGCEDAETYLAVTGEGCNTTIPFFYIDGSVALASPSNMPDDCNQTESPTVWFKIEIDNDYASKLITQVTADGFDAVWAVYKGSTCADMQLVSELTDNIPYNCSSSDENSDNIFQTLLEPASATKNIYYWVSVSATGVVSDPNFTFIYATSLPCLACSGDDVFDCNNGNFVAKIDGVVVEDDSYNLFVQGELVEVCVSFNYNTTGSSNDWFHGFVPTFGSGWDIEASDISSANMAELFDYYETGGECGVFLNGYDLPNVCTYMEDGILKLCNRACNPGGCPCDGGMEDGDPLPSGWWIVSRGLGDGCDSTCSPSTHYGWPSGTNVDVSFCLNLYVKVFDTQEEYEENKDLQITIQTFSDAITGCWNDSNPCVLDPSIQGPAWEISCSSVPKLVFSTHDIEICSGENFVVDISTIDSSNAVLTVIAEDVPNVTGEQDHTLVGFGTIGDILTNLVYEPIVVTYRVTVEDSDPECPSRSYPLYVTVRGTLAGSLTDLLPVCEADNATNEVCALVNGNSENYTYAWNTGDTTSCIQVNQVVTTSYCVTITDDLGCTIEKCTFAFVSPTIISTLEPSDNVVCQGEVGQVDIELMLSGGTAPFTKEWALSAGLVGSLSADSFVYTINLDSSLNTGSPHIITVVVSDVNNCSSSVTTTFYVLDPPILETAVLSVPDAGTSEDVQLSIVTTSGINGNLVNVINIYNCDNILLEELFVASVDSISLAPSECYFVEAMDSGGCVAYDTVSILTATSYTEGGQHEFTVFPNPTSGSFTIAYSEENTSNIQIAIYTLAGKQLTEIQKWMDKGSLSLDLFTYSPGVYLLRMELDERIYYKRIVRL